MSGKLSGREIAANNLKKFHDWIGERELAADWQDYFRGEKLSRTEIAEECGFALSALRQNPALKDALAVLEDRLQAECVFGTPNIAQGSSSASKEDVSRQALDSRLMAAKGKADQRVKALQEQNASLHAEVIDLLTRLERYKQIDEHLSRTGRLLPP